MFKGITSMVFLIAAAALAFFWVQPLYSEIKILSVDKTDYIETIENSKNLQKNRDDLMAQKSQISDQDLENLDKMLPSQENSIRFILEVEKIAKDRGMLLKTIEVGEKAEKVVSENGENEQKTVAKKKDDNKPYQKIPVKMKLAGSYKSIYLFLESLEKNLRLTDIESLSFSAGEADSYEFNLEASIYYKN